MGIDLKLSGSKRQLVKRVVLSALAWSLIVLWSAREVVAQHGMPFMITRLYTGSDGQTHMEKTAMKLRPSSLRTGLDESEPLKPSSAPRFLRWPPGYVYDLHPANERQYVIVVSGRGEVELVGRQKISLQAGTSLLVEDVTGKGHITRTVGSEDLVMLLVPVAVQ